MKIFRGNYGWSTTAHSKTKEGKELKNYVDVSFAKKSEPLNYNEVEGTLIFRSRGGVEYECFFSSYEKKGLIVPKLVLMPAGSKPKVEQTPLTRDDNRDMFGRKTGNVATNDEPPVQNVEISNDELPFY